MANLRFAHERMKHFNFLPNHCLVNLIILLGQAPQHLRFCFAARTINGCTFLGTTTALIKVH